MPECFNRASTLLIKNGFPIKDFGNDILNFKFFESFITSIENNEVSKI